MRKRWIVREANEADVQKLAEEMGVNALTAKILYHRGIRDAQAAKNFLEPENAPFHDPFVMKGMREAVDRIKTAVDSHEKIFVYGDYDVDGMSASAILIRTLKKLGATVDSYIPDRSEGYGLNIPALEQLAAQGCELLISVDCGITNEREIAAVKDKFDVIVTDHHLPALEDVKSAVAVVNPNQRGCPYPEKNLCGAGVAFKLSQALSLELRGVDVQNYTKDIEIAALATVADIVPLVGENRKIVRMGLNEMPHTKCFGLRALIYSAGLNGKKISAGQVGFQLAPRLNSVGRLKTAREGLKLLLTNDLDEAKSLARQFNKINQRRKEIECEILTEANTKVRQMREECGGDLNALVISGHGWLEGVIGLTASKLVERYNLPTINLTTQDGEISRGSCRSIPALHMKKALDTMADLFEQYGGHSQAAGLSIKTEYIPEFTERFNEYVRKNMRDEDFLPVLNVDALIHPSEINLEIAREFDRFEPYGLKNPHPVLACKNVRGLSAKSMGRDNAHLSFDISPEKKIRAVAWGCGNLVPLVENEFIDLAYEPELDVWKDEVRIQCKVTNLEPAAVGEKNLEREELLNVYNFLRRVKTYTDKFDLCTLVRDFNRETGKNLSTYTFDDAIKIFEELGLLIIDNDKKTFAISRPKNKLNLMNSRTFRLSRRNETPLNEPSGGKIISFATAKKQLEIGS